MSKLSNDHREILTMVCVKDMPYQEVADALGIPVGTVRSRLSRARVVVEFHPVVTIADFGSRKALAQYCHAKVSGGVSAAIAGRPRFSATALPAPERKI